MFKQSEEKANFKEVETVIGPSVKVKGNFHGQGNIIIEGVIEGSLKTGGNVFVGDKAKITASIEAKEAKIGGVINGNIKVKGYLELVASAKVIGDLECATLSVEKGATINGKCIMLAGEPTKTEKSKE